MTDPIIAKRLVFHVGGYDPMPPQAVRRRFVRELQRFAGTWSASIASVSEAEVGADEAAWRIVTSGPNWRVETDYRHVRWDDIIEAARRRPTWRRVPLALLAFIDFVAAGALFGYFRTNWRYALFFLSPFLVFAVLAGLAALAGAGIAHASGSAVLGALAALAALALLLRWPGQRLQLDLMFDDWVFARDYVRGRDAVLEPRLDRVARQITEAARRRDADEILIVGHSLGAVLAVDLLDRALALDPALGRTGAPLALLSVGSSIPKIGLHRGARRFRAALERVAKAPGLFWGEYQALTDVMNFYKTNPVECLGMSAAGGPIVRVVRISLMLDPVAYRRIRRNFYRVHCQFISANDRRADYDYFMLLCGPVPAERQVRSPNGAQAAIGPDGTLLEEPSEEPTRTCRSRVGHG